MYSIMLIRFLTNFNGVKKLGIKIGQVVTSKAGRDVGRDFFIIKLIDNQFVYIADGELRSLENPKKKKLKHLLLTKLYSEELELRLLNKVKTNNVDIRKLLKQTISDSRQGEGFPEDGLEMKEVLDIG